MNIISLEKRWDVDGLAKYGFVYKWTDTKRGRYYIGSHWGRFDDGYICSSNSMYKQCKRRPETFTRRILATVTTSRIDLLDVEQDYLDRIPRKDFGDKAYNVSVKVQRPWWAKGRKVKKSVRDKLLASWQNPERKANASKMCKGRKPSEDAKLKMAKAAKKRWKCPKLRAKQSKRMQGNIPWNKDAKGMQVAWNLGLKLPSLSKAHKNKMSKALTGLKRSDEAKASDSKAAKLRWQTPGYREKISENRQNARLSGKLKLNLRQASKIRKLYANGKHTMATLSSDFGVSQSYIYDVIRNDRWTA